ncbi:NUDIX hydrolase [Streptomyces nodosus]|uniref:NUDIX hydrolase n=1 Tax=Streptomyces nodosus TaxID=40318 RepID=UPI003456A79A
MTSGARAPGHPVTAALLMTDPADRLLIVRPVKAGAAKWHLPGGLVEENESPSDAVRREVREELGLTVTVDERDLAAVEWLQATRAGRRDRLAFLFSGPVICPEDTERIQLQREELGAWRWATRAEAGYLLHPAVARRIMRPLQTPRSVLYLETRNERKDVRT